jgi:hypothetical protein
LAENFEVENVQLLTTIFSGNFLSVEIFLQWKWAFNPNCPTNGLRSKLQVVEFLSIPQLFGLY